MRPGGSTPEELETLFEDASVMTDSGALGQLFEHGAVVVGPNDMGLARGREEIERHASSIWGRNCTYVADPRWVVQARDVALVVSNRSISVMRCGSDGAWRYVITLVSWERIQPERETLMTDANKLIVRRKMDELISSGDFAVLNEVFDEEVVSYDPSESEPIRGRDAYRASVEEVLAAFPRRQLRIDDQLSEDDKVVTRWTFTGRHEGELLGIPATGVDVEFSGIDIHLIRNGRIVEERTSWDALGLMRQLGAVSEIDPLA